MQGRRVTLVVGGLTLAGLVGAACAQAGDRILEPATSAVATGQVRSAVVSDPSTAGKVATSSTVTEPAADSPATSLTSDVTAPSTSTEITQPTVASAPPTNAPDTAPPVPATAPPLTAQTGPCPVEPHKQATVAGCGDSNALVLHVQQLLQCINFAMPVDGTSGPGTYGAVVSFQSTHGLFADGLAGPSTQASLEDACASGDY